MYILSRKLHLPVTLQEIQVSPSSVRHPDKIFAALTLGRLLSATILSLQHGRDEYLRKNLFYLAQGAEYLALPEELNSSLRQINQRLSRATLGRSAVMFEIIEFYSSLQRSRDTTFNLEQRLLLDLILGATWMQTADFLLPTDPEEANISALRQVIGVSYIPEYFEELLNEYIILQVANSRELRKLQLQLTSFKKILEKQKLTVKDLEMIQTILRVYLH